MADTDATDSGTGLTGCPFFVGVTGKRELMGQDAQIRAAFQTAFDLIDQRLPRTPKVLLSSLAVGADSIAADAALARPDWTVLAPLPFRREIYEADFDEPGDLARLQAFLAHPRVRVLELSPLRRPGSEVPYAPEDVRRTTPSSPARTLHYEQAGLHILERCGILIAVVDPDEAAGRVGGTGRILQSRLRGLDDTARKIRRDSVELLQEGGLADPRGGPVWRITLRQEPASTGPLPIEVQASVRSEPAPITDRAQVEESLALGLKLDDFNRRIGRLGGGHTPTLGGGPEGLAELRRKLSRVQQGMKGRVMLVVWLIAALFAAAVLSLEVHIALARFTWTEPLLVPYFLAAAAAGALYVLARAGQWQPLSEDYRAVSEALRVQIVLWQSGLVGPGSRVDTMYLRGKSGSLGLVRELVGHIVEAARQWSTPPELDARKAEAWVDTQLAYFQRRLRTRHGAVEFVRSISWFLFAVGLVLSACLAGLQAPPFAHLAAELASGHALPVSPAMTLVAGVALTAICFATTLAVQRNAAAVRPRHALNLHRVAGVLAAVLGGSTMALAMAGLVGLLPSGSHAGLEASLHQLEELLILAAVMSTTIAGALRFVSEKLSWEAELDGYEHAMDFFARAKESLAAQATSTSTEADRKALVQELAAEALRENEAWLLAHRERPLEPVMGG